MAKVLQNERRNKVENVLTLLWRSFRSTPAKKIIVTSAVWYNMTHHDDYWEKEYGTDTDTSDGSDLAFSDSSISSPGVTIHFWRVYLPLFYSLWQYAGSWLAERPSKTKPTKNIEKRLKQSINSKNHGT